MSPRRARIVVLCEDKLHEVFIRRFLKCRHDVTERDIRIVALPAGSGSGEQHVRDRLPKEIEAWRSRRAHQSVALVAMVDADKLTVKQRVDQIKDSCRSQSVDYPGDGELAFALFVPRRNIGTWLRYLRGKDCDEEMAYREPERESDCQPQVERLAEICRRGQFDEPPSPPDSLVASCEEYNRSLKEFLSKPT